MNEKDFREIIEKSPIGYAYHKIILNEQGKPCDYEFIDVNSSFEKYTGLKAAGIIGKRVTEVIPGIEKDSLNWIGMYGGIALDKSSREFEQYSGPLKRYYRILAYSPEKNYFITLFSDITLKSEKEKQQVINFKSLFENMQSGAIIYEVINDGKTSRDYIVKDINSASLKMEAKAKEQVIGKSVYELRPKVDEFGIIKVFREVWETGVSKKFPAKLYPGEHRWFENDIFKLSANEIVTVYNDVTKIMQTQEQLKESRNKFKKYIDKAPLGIFLADENGKYLEVNKEACDMTGYTEKELCNFDIRQISVIEDHENALKSFQSVKAKGFSEIDSKYITKTGQIRDWNVRAVKLNEKRFLGFAKDITDRKMLERKRVETENEYRALFDNAGLEIGYYKPDGTIIWYNKVAAQIMGGIPEDFAGKNLKQFFSAKDSKEYMRRIKKVMKTRKLETYEDEVKDKNGKSWYRSVYTCIYNSEDELLGIEVVSQNITDLRKSQKSLAESEERYRSIFDQAALGISNISLDGRIINANKKYCEILGYSLKEIKKLTFLDFTHPDDIKKSKDGWEKLISGKIDDLNFDKKYIRKDGRVINIILTASLLRDSNSEPMYSITTIQDITVRKELEENNAMMEARLRDQQKLEAIGTLAGGVAHEINNPINGIMNYSQLILDLVDEKGEASGYAKEILHETNRVAEIVKNLLQFSRREKQQYSKANVEDIINQTLSLVNTIIKLDQIDFEVNIPRNLSKINCRSQQIQQVLMNLLTNARDALNQKYEGYHEDKKLILSCKKIVKYKKGWIRIIVEDHGNGIPEDIQQKIFDPFYTTKERDKGTGLGLAISYGIIKDHHGELTFKTKEGEYTKFYLDLPIDNGWHIEGTEE